MILVVECARHLAGTRVATRWVQKAGTHDRVCSIQFFLVFLLLIRSYFSVKIADYCFDRGSWSKRQTVSVRGVVAEWCRNRIRESSEPV